MRSFLRLAKVKARPANDELLLEFEIFSQDVAQGKYFRLGLIVNKGEHIYRKRCLERRQRIEVIENHLRVCVLLCFYNDTHTVSVRFVAQVGNAFKPLVLYEICNRSDQHSLVHLIRQLRYYDSFSLILAVFFKMASGADDNSSSAGFICRSYAASAHNYSPCREIGAFYVLHKLVERRFRVIKQADCRPDDLAEVMRGDIRRHTDGNTGRTVYKQVRKS